MTPRQRSGRASAGRLGVLLVALVLLHLADVTSGRRVHSKRYSESGPQAQQAAPAAGQTVAPEEDEDYDSTEAEDDERVYKNPRNSPSAVCPRDEEHANFLGQTCLRKCSSDEDCKSKKKKCRCDGMCGMSCIKPDRECPDLDQLAIGNVTTTGRFFGDSATYTCEAGFHLVGLRVRTCQADGKWSGQAPTCKSVYCRTPPPMDHARHSALPAQTTFDVGTTLKYQCHSGYVTNGFPTAKCLAMGGSASWFGPDISCEPRTCGQPADPENGWHKASCYTYTCRATYECAKEYELVGRAERTCQADGTWSPKDLPTCVLVAEVECPAPENPTNGRAIYTRQAYNSVVSYECNYGYSLVGDSTRRCGADRRWSGHKPACQVYCPFPGYVENGKVMLVGNMGLYDYRPYVRKVTNNKQIMYDCDRGYVLAEGPPGATCLSGDWSPKQLPRCVPGKHPRLRWSRSVRQRRAALYAARLRALSSWSSEGSSSSSGGHSDNEESNHVVHHHRLTAATPAPSVEFQPWGAPVMDHDTVQDSSLLQPSEASRDLVRHLLGKNLSPDGQDHPRGHARAPQDSAHVAGNPDMRHSDSHPLYGRVQPAHNGAEPMGMPSVVSWFTADGRTREQWRAERARRAAHPDQDPDDDDVSDSESDSESDESSSSSAASSEETSHEHHAATPGSTKSPTQAKNGTVLSRQARASRTRVGPQVMRANRHRGGDRRKSTKTRKDSTKKTSPGNTVTCESLDINSFTHVVVTKPGRDHNDSASSGSTVLVTCEVGYQLSIGVNLTAKCVRGRWKPAKPECIIVPCRIPETEHAIYRRVNDSALLIEDTEVSSDEEVKFSCINGYNPVGALRFRCKHGEWDVSELPWCEPGDDTNYRGSDSGGDIDLFGEVDKGDRRSCTPPGKVQGSLVYINGHPMKDGEMSFPDGTEVTFNCMASIMGEKSTWRILCEDGTWLGRSLSCDMEDLADSKMRDNTTCTLRSTEPNVVSFHNDQLITVDVVDLPAGAVVVSRCRDIGKYQLIGSSHRRCVSGEWDGQKPVCFGLNQENDYALEKPPTILFRHRLGAIAQSNDGKLIVYPGVVLHMECLWIRRFGTPKWSVSHSYRSNNSAVIVLTDTLNTTNSTDAPQKIYPTGWNSEDGRDSALEYRLSILHASQDDSGEFTCTTPTRHTHSVTIEVKAVNCPKLPDKRGLVYSSTSTKMNSRVSMSCPGGNSLIGASEIVCLASGNWSAPFPVCESESLVVNCEAPGTPDHGYTTGQGPPYRAGDIVQFNCNPQFMMEGQPIIACQENGRWSGSVPKCKQLAS